jgi:ABC-type sulfate/molybdate transport systems ATPase subunit
MGRRQGTRPDPRPGSPRRRRPIRALDGAVPTGHRAILHKLGLIPEFQKTAAGRGVSLGGLLLRPHDIDVRHLPDGATAEAMVERLVDLGFEVRADLLLGDGQRVWAQLSREEADELELAQGQIVFVRPSRTRQFADAPAG